MAELDQTGRLDSPRARGSARIKRFVGAVLFAAGLLFFFFAMVSLGHVDAIIRYGKAAYYSAAGQRAELVLPVHGLSAPHAGLSPDGKLIVTAAPDNTVRLWDTETGDLVTILEGHEERPGIAAFSPDGRRIVTASQVGLAHLWNVATGEAIAVLEAPNHVVVGAAFSPDGTRVVTAGRDHTARLWNAATGEALAVLDGHLKEILKVAFGAGGSLVLTVSGDGSARLWDAGTGEPLVTIYHERINHPPLDSSRDSQRSDPADTGLTGSDPQVPPSSSLLPPRDVVGTLGMAAFSPDGKRVVTTANPDHSSAAQLWDGADDARLWDAATGDLLTIVDFDVFLVRVHRAAFSPDGKRLVTVSTFMHSAHTAQLWDVSTDNLVASLAGHDEEIHAVAFSPDGQRVATASRDGTARLWTVEAGELLAVLVGHDGGVDQVAFSPDGKRIVTVGEDDVRVWRAKTGPGEGTGGPTGPVVGETRTPNSQQAVCDPAASC